MLVKCIDTGEKIDRNKAYKITIVKEDGKTSNKYYSSKEGYDIYISNNYYRRNCIDLIREVMGYALPQMKLPTLTYKKIEEYKDPIGYDVLYNTLLNNKKDIEYAFYNKDFRSEIARVQYLFGIVQNTYMEEWKKKVANKKAEAIKKTEDMEEAIETWETTERKKSVKNLGSYLDDED